MVQRSLRAKYGIFLLTFTLFAAATAARAQAPRGRGRGPGAVALEQINQALGGLDLSNDQRQKIESILSAARDEARGMLQEMAQADAPTRRGRARGFADDLHGKIVAVLTPEQQPLFERHLQDLRGAAPGQRPLGQVVERFYDFVLQVGLSDEQKPKIESLFSETRQKLRTLLDNPPGDGTAPDKVQEIVQELRSQLASTLSQQQLQQLRDLVAADETAPARGGRAGRGGRGGRAGRAGVAMLPDNPEMMPPMAAGAQPGGGASIETKTEPAPLPAVGVGQPAPDFTLNSLDNHPISLSTYKGKVVLLVFGSYSSPSFRDRAAGLEHLRTTYFNRLNILVIYTKENYPAGEWDVDRNKEDAISIPQPADLASRSAEAKKARTALHLTTPFLVDTMEDTTTAAYGVSTNAAILIGKDGNILARQQWFEPYALRRYIDDAVK